MNSTWTWVAHFMLKDYLVNESFLAKFCVSLIVLDSDYLANGLYIQRVPADISFSMRKKHILI